MKDKAAHAALCAVIRRDLKSLQKLDRELQALKTDPMGETDHFRENAVIGYVLHNIYNALENIFEQISNTFENHVVLKSQRHRVLLDKMFLEIPGIRPALFDENIKKILNDLHGFRHIFRHRYDYELDTNSLKNLETSWNQQKNAVFDSLQRFSDSLLEDDGE